MRSGCSHILETANGPHELWLSHTVLLSPTWWSVEASSTATTADICAEAQQQLTVPATTRVMNNGLSTQVCLRWNHILLAPLNRDLSWLHVSGGLKVREVLLGLLVRIPGWLGKRKGNACPYLITTTRVPLNKHLTRVGSSGAAQSSTDQTVVVLYECEKHVHVEKEYCSQWIVAG